MSREPGAGSRTYVLPAPDSRLPTRGNDGPGSHQARGAARHGDADNRRPTGDGAEGDADRRGGEAGRHRHPGLLLRAAARPGRGLPHVPRRDREDAEAPDRLHLAGGRRDGRADRRAAGARGAERRPRHAPRQPPARLPGLRQGRRVPLAGHHLQLRPRRQPVLRAEAHLHQADPAQPTDRARPRALHHVLPLRPLPARDRRRRGADGDRPRLALRDRGHRGRHLRLALLRQHDRTLPGRRADLDPLPLPRAPLGPHQGPERLQRVQRRLQHPGGLPQQPGAAPRIARQPGR